MPEKVETPNPKQPKMLFRTATIERASLKADSREISLAFASEEPVERYDWRTGKTYFEILDHSSPESADLTRLDNSGQLLFEHDRTKKLGGVVKGSVKLGADKKSRAIVKFSRSDLAEGEFQDIQDGIPRNVSFGYDTRGMIKSEVREGAEYRWYRWEAFEISLVTIEADTTVGIGRADTRSVDTPPETDVAALAQNLTPENKMKLRALLDPAPATREAGGESAADREARESKFKLEVAKSERARLGGIQQTMTEFERDFGKHELVDAKGNPTGLVMVSVRAIADDYFTGKKEGTLRDFQFEARELLLKARPPQVATLAKIYGKDHEEYSLVRAIQNCLIRDETLPDPDTFEGDAHVKMSKLNLGVDNKGFLVPPDANLNPRALSRQERRALHRDMTAGNFGQGGATVQTDLLLPIIELLRNMLVTDRLGVQTLSGLSGNVVIPRQTAAATGQSLAETAALAVSTQAIDQVAMTPHRVGAFNKYSKQLLLQSSIDVEAFIRNDLFAVIALLWDRLTLNGQGAQSEPLGIINTPGVNVIVFGAAATYAKMVDFETAIASLNAPEGSRAYATSPVAKGALKKLAKLLTGATTVAAFALWENDTINGYPAVASNQIPNNQLLFGSWPECIRGLWGGLDVVVDPYTSKTSALVEIAMNTWGDSILRHPQSFAISADSAAQ